MPVEAKPIFRPDVIRLPILGYTLPDPVLRSRPKLQKWAEIIASGSVNAHKEVEILGDFLNDVFCELLGYTRAVDDSEAVHVLAREARAGQRQVRRRRARRLRPGGEAVRRGGGGQGAKDPLDRPFAGRKVSAVNQAFDYAINLRCPWILVTNIRQTRLYYKGADKQTYERFDTEALASDERQLKKFVFLLHAERMVPATGRATSTRCSRTRRRSAAR